METKLSFGNPKFGMRRIKLTESALTNYDLHPIVVLLSCKSLVKTKPGLTDGIFGRDRRTGHRLYRSRTRIILWGLDGLNLNE